jgi:glycosyltransferase involved in cell wall biosynthesis
MRVLQANKFFFVKGGAERYFFDLLELLPARGHPVAPFSMQHSQNAASSFDRHFVPEVDYADSRGLGAARAAARTVFHPGTARRVRALVREFRPDVAHLHNVHHQLGGALFEELAELRVPIVQTLHDFQWVCPVYTFVRDGRVCESCRHGHYLPAVRHRCHGGSLSRSLVAALELGVGYWRGWEREVVRFLAPSRFLGEKVVEHGLSAAKVRILGYCLRRGTDPEDDARGGHALYAGRLSHEKGVATLLEALARVPGLELRIAGTGPLEPALREAAERLSPGRVRFLGYLDPHSLRRELAGCAFSVVPSEWYENQPYAILESFAAGTPVVGAAIGGIPELVEPGRTGALFEAGSAESLAEALASMQADRVRPEMGREARRRIEERFDPGRHLDALTEVYREAAEGRAPVRGEAS